MRTGSTNNTSPLCPQELAYAGAVAGATYDEDAADGGQGAWRDGGVGRRRRHTGRPGLGAAGGGGWPGFPVQLLCGPRGGRTAAVGSLFPPAARGQLRGASVGTRGMACLFPPPGINGEGGA